MSKSFHRCIWLTASLIAATLMLDGCAGMPPGGAQPGSQLPAARQWDEGNYSGATVVTRDAWWRVFQDRTLNELIERALLKADKNVAGTAIQVLRAQLHAGLTPPNAPPAPELSAQVGAPHGRNAVEAKSRAFIETVGYEQDLWRRLASAPDAGSWQEEISPADREIIELALIGTEARVYWQIAYLNERIAALEAGLAREERLRDRVDAQYASGTVPVSDQVQIRIMLAARSAELDRLLQQRTQARHAQAFLFDLVPEGAVPEPQKLPAQALPAVTDGLEVGLLRQRPDLREAEQRLLPYLVEAGGTENCYPAFPLTRTAGASSSSLQDALHNPDAALGTGLTLPYSKAHGTRVLRGKPGSESGEALSNFRRVLHSALREVEDALSLRARFRQENGRLLEALAEARKTEILTENGYGAGSASLHSLLEAQEKRQELEMRLAENRLNQLKNLMTIGQVFGGLGLKAEPMP